MTRHQWWARPIRALVVTATRTLAAAILAPAIGCGENRTVPGSPTGPSSPTPPLRTTWSVGGTVTDSLLAVGNARVEIVSGDGAGASTRTGPGGNYLLGGAAGDVEVRASLPGLESQVRSTASLGSNRRPLCTRADEPGRRGRCLAIDHRGIPPL